MSNQHTNQPDHTEEVLEMVTDTNQARRKAKLEKQMLNFERKVVALERVYKYVTTRPDFDLRKNLPNEIRDEIAGIQKLLLDELNKLKLEYAEIDWKYETEETEL